MVDKTYSVKLIPKSSSYVCSMKSMIAWCSFLVTVLSFVTISHMSVVLRVGRGVGLPLGEAVVEVVGEAVAPIVGCCTIVGC